MSHVLATVLVSLTLPAVALAIIARMERAQKDPHDEQKNPAIDPNVLPASAAKAADVTERPYRERAG